MSKELKSVKQVPTNKNGSNSSMNLGDPRNVFLSAALSMSWQLAIIVLVPIVGGYELDQHFKTTPLFFIIGIVITIVGFVSVLRRVLKEFNTSFIKPGVRK